MKTLLFCIVVVLLAVGFIWQTSPLLFKTSFESDYFKSGWKMAQTCCDYSLQRSKQVARSGNYSLRVSLNSQDKNVAGGKRSELAMGAEMNPQVDRWYGFSIFIPEDYQTDDQSEIFAQWHDAAPVSLIRSPPVSLHLYRGQWRIALYWGAQKFTTKLTASKKLIDMGAFERNKWTDFVFHIKFSYTDNGILEVWKDGKQLVNYVGPNFYNDDNGPYFKIGLYKYPWNSGKNLPQSNKVFYIDDVAIGNEKATYADVAPGQPVR